MFDNLNANIVTASDEDIDDVFGGEDTDKGAKGKKADQKKPAPASGKDKTKTQSSPEKTVLGSPKSDTMTDFSDEDDDVFSSQDDEDEDEVKPAKGKDKAGKSKKSPIEVDEDEDETSDDDEDETPADDDEDEEKDKDKDDDEDEDNDDDETSEETKAFLKARADLLIKKGKWADFEGSEDFEWTEDNFAEMEVQQVEYARQQMREELLESFGPYGKEIADYAAKGGDPDKLIDIFKEEQLVSNLSIESAEDQRAVIMKYETEFLNKKPERVKKYIDSLEADKELESYAKEAKEAMEEALETEKENIKAEQDAIVIQNQKRQKATMQKFQSDVSGLVDKATDIPADEKKEILRLLTKFDKKLKNGSPVNEFYFKFEQFRKDLPNYIKLVRFVMNPDKFIKTIENTGKNKANEKAFRLAVGANKSKKAKAAGVEPNSGKSGKTSFKLL